MSQIKIPILDLTPEIEELWDDLMAAVERVLRSGRFILGPEVEAFEHEVAEYLGVKHAVGVNSGTDALLIGLRALGIGPGDEVITTPFTFFATPESISNAGATPVFVDIDPRTFNIDPALIEPAITERTKAIVPVHLYGQACDMDVIMDIARQHDLRVLEDTAQAMGGTWRGRKLASIGDAGALSFFPSKNLGGFGDGGMIVTNRDDVADLARMLRAHGSKKKYANEMLGYNSRLDELQAAILRVKLPHVDRRADSRREMASAYDESLRGSEEVAVPYVHPDARHVFHQYTIRVRRGRRDDVLRRLAGDGVSAMVYYPVPCGALPVYSQVSPARAAQAATEVLSLPIGPSMNPGVVTRVVRAL